MPTNYGQYYKASITAAKGVKTWPVWLTAILAIMPTSLEELQQNWPAVVVLLVATVQPMVQNWWKHGSKPKTPLWVILAPLLGILVTGCATGSSLNKETYKTWNPETNGWDESTFLAQIEARNLLSRQNLVSGVESEGPTERENGTVSKPWRTGMNLTDKSDATDMINFLTEILNAARQLAPLYAPPSQPSGNTGELTAETPDE